MTPGDPPADGGSNVGAIVVVVAVLLVLVVLVLWMSGAFVVPSRPAP